MGSESDSSTTLVPKHDPGHNPEKVPQMFNPENLLP
jgi:hypothetical protein